MNTELIFVCKRQDFTGEDSRFLVTVGQRKIAIIAYRGKFYALDNACYHHGGPLLMGDIEEIAGHTCLLCPWHHYPISLESGEGFYMGLEFSTLNSGGSTPSAFPPCHPNVLQKRATIKSKGCRQRIHAVEVRGDDVFLHLNTDPVPLDSDTYATSNFSSHSISSMVAPVEKR